MMMMMQGFHEISVSAIRGEKKYFFLSLCARTMNMFPLTDFSKCATASILHRNHIKKRVIFEIFTVTWSSTTEESGRQKASAYYFRRAASMKNDHLEKGFDRVFESKRRTVDGAPGGSFRLSICCFVLKTEHFKGECGRKSRPNFALFNPLKIKEGVDEMSE